MVRSVTPTIPNAGIVAALEGSPPSDPAAFEEQEPVLTDELFEEMMQALEGGKTLRFQHEEEGMPRPALVWAKIRANAVAERRFREAREVFAHSAFELAVDLGKGAADAPGAKVKGINVTILTLMKAAGLVLPTYYSDKAGQGGGTTVVINTGLDLGDGKQQIGVGTAAYTISAEQLRPSKEQEDGAEGS